MVPSFLANIDQESQFNPDAVSPTGVVGMAQVTVATGKLYGQVNRNDPVQSLTAGARYWRDLIKTFGPNPALGRRRLQWGRGSRGQGDRRDCSWCADEPCKGGAE